MRNLIFIDLSSLSNLSNLEFSGYHINSAGQVYCYFDKSGIPLRRVDRNYNRHIPNTMCLSMSSLKNKVFIFQVLLGRKLIQGYQISIKNNTTKAVLQQHADTARLRGFSDFGTAEKNKFFQDWHSQAKAKLKSILQDRAEFKEDSLHKDAYDSIRDAIDLSNRDNRIGHDTLKEIIDRAYNDHVVESIISS